MEETEVEFSVDECPRPGTDLAGLSKLRPVFSATGTVTAGNASQMSDGAAAVVMVGDEHPLAAQAPLQVTAGRSHFIPDTERVMGWDVVDSGFKVILAPTVAEVVAREMPVALDALLADQGMARDELGFFVGHPGGPKVLRSAAEALGLSDDDFALSWQSLARNGNMSSTSVLFVLADVLAAGLTKGSRGLLFAFGPAFCAELALLRAR